MSFINKKVICIFLIPNSRSSVSWVYNHNFLLLIFMARLMTLVTTSPLDTAHPGFRADIDKGDVIMNKNYDSRYSFTADTIGPHLMMSAVRLDCRLSRNDSYLILIMLSSHHHFSLVTVWSLQLQTDR